MRFILMKTFKGKKRFFTVLTVLAAFVLCFLAVRLNYYFEAKAVRQSVASLTPSIANKKIVVDPGHGGFDLGAAGENGVLEKDITLAVGKRLAAFLKQAGAEVLLTRDTGADLSEPGATGLSPGMNEDLKRRAALANEYQADLLVSIHVNSYPGNGPHGARTFVPPGSPASKKAGQAIQSALSAQLKNTDRVTQEIDCCLTRLATMPAVLVELGFITNTVEGRLLPDPDYQDKLGWAIHAGIVSYFSTVEEDSAAMGKEAIIQIFKEQSPDYLGEP